MTLVLYRWNLKEFWPVALGVVANLRLIIDRLWPS